MNRIGIAKSRDVELLPLCVVDPIDFGVVFGAYSRRLPIIHEALTRRIIGVCMQVSNELGAGFHESVYHRAFIALHDDGLPAQSKPEIRSFEAVMLEHSPQISSSTSAFCSS